MGRYANIMVAPKLGNPDVDVLILGALGCGAFRGDPVLMAKLWVPFLTSPACPPRAGIHGALEGSSLCISSEKLTSRLNLR